MAEIPSDLASSAAQSGYLSREISKERDASRAGQSNATNRQIRSVDEAGDVVDTSDDDTQIYSDAEGQGGQGRDLENEVKQNVKDTPAPTDGVIRDEDGTVHLDLEA